MLYFNYYVEELTDRLINVPDIMEEEKTPFDDISIPAITELIAIKTNDLKSELYSSINNALKKHIGMLKDISTSITTKELEAVISIINNN